MVSTPGEPTKASPPQKHSSHHRGKRRDQHRRRHKKLKHEQKKTPDPPGPTCVVCSTNDKPVVYKCPKCRIPYCSVACCKEHKKVCPGKPPEVSTQSTAAPPRNWYDPALLGPSPWNHRSGSGFSDNDDDDDYRLTDETKESLKRSSWLRDELKDGGLQEVIRRIAESRNIESLQLARQRFPRFDNFVDKLLVLGGVLQRERNEDEESLEPLEEWLAQEWTNGQSETNLVLNQPVKRIPVFEPVDVSSSSSSEGESSSGETTDSSDDDSDSDDDGD